MFVDRFYDLQVSVRFEYVWTVYLNLSLVGAFTYIWFLLSGALDYPNLKYNNVKKVYIF